MEIKIVKAVKNDLSAIKAIEDVCFIPCQKTSDKALLRSFKSRKKEIFIVKCRKNNKWESIAFLFLHKYKYTLRITSIAVLPDYRNFNIGKNLIEHTISLAKEKAFCKISLEVIATNNALIEWYEKFGFKTFDFMHDYYDEYVDGFRMKLILD